MDGSIPVADFLKPLQTAEKKSLMHALMEIEEGTSQQFDPKRAEAFNQVIEILEL